jgi:acyl-CoA dehydrogenase
MRGTGSHDVEITNVFLDDAVMQGVRRPAGKWHPFMHLVVLVAIPIFYGAYVGVLERAREIALGLAQRKKDDPLIAILAGELENQVVTAQIAHASMVQLTATANPGQDASNAMLCRRTILVTALTRGAEKALELGGGAGFYRAAGLERCFRDLQAARYHPVPEKPQTALTGRFLLGFDFDS